MTHEFWTGYYSLVSLFYLQFASTAAKSFFLISTSFLYLSVSKRNFHWACSKLGFFSSPSSSKFSIGILFRYRMCSIVWIIEISIPIKIAQRFSSFSDRARKKLQTSRKCPRRCDLRKITQFVFFYLIHVVWYPRETRDHERTIQIKIFKIYFNAKLKRK